MSPFFPPSSGSAGLQVSIAGLRFRVELDEQRVTDMLRGLSAATLGDDFGPTAGSLLSCLGDVASVSFMPSVSGGHCRQRPSVWDQVRFCTSWGLFVTLSPSWKTAPRSAKAGGFLRTDPVCRRKQEASWPLGCYSDLGMEEGGSSQKRGRRGKKHTTE